MNDYYYKFPDEATAQAILSEYYDAENGWKTSGDGYALDPVGPLFDNNEAGDLVPLEGWHVNLRVLDNRPTLGSEYLVVPEHPRRVWL